MTFSPQIFDSHAHYDDSSFDNDREQLLANLPKQNVCGVINAAIDLCTARSSIALSETYPYIWAAVGIYPEEVGKAPEDAIDTLRTLLTHPRVVAVGEIGLDYHYDSTPRDIQLKWFEHQLALAVELDKPVIIHDREAHADTMRLIRQYHPKGVLHCYSGSIEMAQELLSLGMYIGLGGAVTFKNAKKPVEVAAMVSSDRLVLETDAPYMAPVPVRGARCDSSMIAHTAARIAEIRSETVDVLLRQTHENACRLFHIPAKI